MMEQIKGFSLIEVLVSLFLVTTIALGLLEQHSKVDIFMQQVSAYSKASNLLDQSYETIFADQKLKNISDPEFFLDVHKNKQGLFFQVYWFHGSQSIIRKHLNS